MKNTHILIVQTAFLGDLCLSIPFFKRVKKLWPQARLHVLARKGFRSFLLETGLVDEVYEIEKGSSSSYKDVLQIVKLIDFDIIFSPHESLRTALFVNSLKAKEKVSYKNFWNFLFFNKRIIKDSFLPEPLRQMSLLTFFDSELSSLIKEAHVQGPLMAVPDYASMAIKERFNSRVHIQGLKKNLDFFESPFIVLFPGSVWETKRWPEESFIQVGQHWAQIKNTQVVIMGGLGEESLGERVARAIPSALSLVGKTNLVETLFVLSKAQVVLTNDSASQHLAAIVEAPTLAIFGPTLPEFGFRPWNNKAKIVEAKEVFCRPCGKHGHQKCPLGTHECMKKVSSDQVLRALDELLLFLHR